LGKLEPKETVIGDKGYLGEKGKIVTPFKSNQATTEAHKKFNEVVHSERAIVENVKAEIKQFAALSQTWRGRLDTITQAFHAVCTVVEIKHLLRLAQLEAEGSDSEQEEPDVEDQQDEPMEERQDEIGLGIVVVA